jgi:hypothetical protein
MDLSLGQQLEISGSGEGLGAVPGAQFAVDVIHVRLDGAQRDIEVAGDLGVGSARCEEREYLKLSLAQILIERLWRSTAIRPWTGGCAR